MSLIRESSSSAVLLQYIKFAIHKSGAMKEIAHRIGTRRGWATHQDPERQLKRWALNVNQMLDGLAVNRHWSLLDHLDACDVLGFDPLGNDDRQAA